MTDMKQKTLFWVRPDPVSWRCKKPSSQEAHRGQSSVIKTYISLLTSPSSRHFSRQNLHFCMSNWKAGLSGCKEKEYSMWFFIMLQTFFEWRLSKRLFAPTSVCGLCDNSVRRSSVVHKIQALGITSPMDVRGHETCWCNRCVGREWSTYQHSKLLISFAAVKHRVL